MEDQTNIGVTLTTMSLNLLACPDAQLLVGGWGGALPRGMNNG